MPNTLKRNIVKIRDRLFRDMYKSILDISSKTDLLIQEQDKLRSNQQEQLLLTSELSTQIKNSGAISVKENEVLVKLFNGLKIYLDMSDIAVAPHIALDRIWEPEITTAWLSLIKAEDTVVDIGANFGYFGLLAAFKTNKKKSKIIFIEANTHLIYYIHKTLSLNWYNEQSVVENFALSDKNGETVLNVLHDYIGSSSIQNIEKLNSYVGNKMQLKVEESLKVPSRTLDDYCKEKNIKNIDLIKMDIEGYEEKAYKGMRGIVKKSPNLTMFIEFTHKGYDNPEQFYNLLLKDFGHVYLINKEGNIFKPKNNNYKHIVGSADDWAMPIFSKNANLSN